MHISSFTLKFTYLTSCCRYQPFKPHLFECIRTAALDSQTSCSGGSWSFCLHLRSQEPATTLSRMLRLDSKAGLQLCTQTEVYLHTSDIMYIYTVIGKRVRGSPIQHHDHTHSHSFRSGPGRCKQGDGERR